MATLKIFWDNVPNAISYNLYWKTSSGVTIMNGNLISNIKQVVYYHENLQATTTYYYIVVAVDKNGNLSAPSSEFSAISSAE